MEDKNKEIFDLYTLAEMAYEKHFKDEETDIDLLYPEGWYIKKNYKEKIEILSEAIKTNTLIAKTEKYQSSIEGVQKIIIKE